MQGGLAFWLLDLRASGAVFVVCPGLFVFCGGATPARARETQVLEEY